MMARNIDNRLVKLKARRSGTDRLNRLSEGERLSVQVKSFIDEPWQKRAPATPYTRYALGAMEAVDPDYTRISLETARRVEKQLEQGLSAAGFSVDFRVQGSVPLNIHIRGVSDVDLLNLDISFLTYDRTGQQAAAGAYWPVNGKTSSEVIGQLRSAAEKVLITKFPQAEVDTTGAKAISISGGSLARPVDVVPSHWYDTVAYQQSGEQHDRAVAILNRKTNRTIDNWPFLHIKRVEDRCKSCLGGLRKAIRLCKNVKADAEEEGQGEITLPSFDIAAIMYHADQNPLIIGSIYELAILVETQRHLDDLYNNQTKAGALSVPDGSRLIFDTPEKFKGLLRLSSEIDDLLMEVAREQSPSFRHIINPTFAQARAALSNISVPAAA